MEKEKLEKKIKATKFVRIFLNVVFGFLFVGSVAQKVYLIVKFTDLFGSQFLYQPKLLLGLIEPAIIVLFLFLNNFFTKKYIKKYQDALLKI